MFNLIKLANVLEALLGAARSRTTRDQFTGSSVLLVALCAIAAVCNVYADVDTDTLLTAIVAAMTLLAPLASRVAAKLHDYLKAETVDSNLLAIAVRTADMVGVWHEYKGALNNAKVEKWDFALLADGKEVALKRLELTGAVKRVKPAKGEPPESK